MAQSVLDERVDFNADKLPLKNILFQLSQQTKINFAFNGNIIPNRKISAQFRKKKIAFILDVIFEGTEVAYKLVDQQVILFKKEKTIFYTISGYIKDADTKERLIAANVFEEKHRKGIATNEYGFFSMTFPKGEILLHFSFLGYRSKAKKFNLKRNIQLNIDLKPSLTLNEVIVTSKGLAPNNFTFSQQANTIALATIEQMPTIGGEEDLFRSVSLLAGVQTGPDGFGGLNIRGGSADQNLILLDGVPVYNATHSGGLFSIFNTNAIKSAQLYKGKFPARFGGRLSSILDIRTKEGNQRSFNGKASIGLVSMKAAIEGPIVTNKSSYFISFRRSLFDLFLRPISKKVKKNKGDIGATNHTFFDINSKINFNLGKKDQLFISWYHGNDRFKDENKTTSSGVDFRKIQHDQDLKWGNYIGAFRWNHLFSDQLFANTTLTFSKFWFGSEEFYNENIINFGQEETEENSKLFYNLYNSSIEDKSAKIDFDFIPNPNHYIKFGFNFINHTFRPGAFTLDHNSVLGVNDRNVVDSLISINNTVNSQEYALYFENNWTISTKLKANLGFRNTFINVQSTPYFSFQPRVSLTYLLNKSTYLTASVNKMMQNLHLLTASGIGLPTDLWVPATSKVKPQEAWQTSLGLYKQLKNGLVIDSEIYYKRMNNLITYQEGSSFLIESIVLDASNWENKVTAGKGISYGFELSLKKNFGKLRTWLNYSYSKSTRQFDEVNFGERFNFRFDRPHSFKIAGTYFLSDRINFSANWSYETGIATTLPTGEYTFYSSNLFSPVTVLNVGAKNSFRLPNNHHLDVGLNFDFGKKKGQQILKIGVYNLYNQKNPLYYRLREKPNANGEKEFVQVTLLPITPSVSYTARF
jgi:outer membrane receptor for ferrienterochelin and colicin